MLIEIGHTTLSIIRTASIQLGKDPVQCAPVGLASVLTILVAKSISTVTMQAAGAVQPW